jgi:hypothetical protein
MFDLDGIEYVSSYVSSNGQVISSSCAPESVTGRPTGEITTYPPTAASGLPTSFNTVMNIDTHNTLDINIEGILVGSGDEFYGRSLGHSWGTLIGVSLPSGTSFWDLFALVGLLI